ncbi:hypothetical protein AwErysi_01520 [Erysipelotrichaceae bacterium]|nr:hypothetical protein AwErysi_01520 [Erysipelotrichaceae bacterium]
MQKKDITGVDLIKIKYIPTKIKKIILVENPEKTEKDSIHKDDLIEYQRKYLEEVLEVKDSEAAINTKKIIDSLSAEKFKAISLEEKAVVLTKGQKVADRIAEFGGSWTFISCFGVVLVSWIIINSVPIFHINFDEYPFILLNLILSCLAAIQAPIIMMSQNRQEARDRRRAESDYKINLKAEIEIRLLNDKIDCILNEQIPDLLAINAKQLEEIEKHMQTLQRVAHQVLK